MAVPAWEYLDRRALASLVLIDAVGRRALVPMTVIAPGVRIYAKRPGELVVVDAPGLRDHTTAFFTPPAVPALGSVAVGLDLVPASPAFGPRRFELALPRDPDPANAGNANSLFRPVEIPLLPAPGATVTGLVAALRVTVTRATDGRCVEGALVRLRPEGGRPQARALTDAAGDALLLVPGVALASPGAGGVVLPDIAADLDTVIDPALSRFNDPLQLDVARAAAAGRMRNLIDPDDLEARLGGAATPAQNTRIAAGRTRTAAIAWSPP